MPLLDHLHPPLSEERRREGFLSKWTNLLVEELNQTLLPPGYFAEPHVRVGVGAGVRPDLDLTTPTLPAPTLVLPAVFPDVFAVQVFGTETGPRLVAAVELVSPTDKDDAGRRRAFAVKCASCLCQGIGLILVDVVAGGGNLHDEIVGLLPGAASFLFPAAPPLYAAAYRPIRRDPADQIDSWLTPLAVSEPLPVLPLALTAELCLPVNLESSYNDACQKLRLK